MGSLIDQEGMEELLIAYKYTNDHNKIFICKFSIISKVVGSNILKFNE